MVKMYKAIISPESLTDLTVWTAGIGQRFRYFCEFDVFCTPPWVLSIMDSL